MFSSGLNRRTYFLYFFFRNKILPEKEQVNLKYKITEFEFIRREI